MKFMRVCRPIVLGLVIFLNVNHVQAQQSPFSGLNGKWSGTGVILLGSGAKERIKCRATYSVTADGNNLQQSLRCASDSYRFDLTSSVMSQVGVVSGIWNESSRGIGGALAGSARQGQVRLLVTSPTFSASLSLSTQGDRQSVSVTAPPGGQLTGVNITLSRSK